MLVLGGDCTVGLGTIAGHLQSAEHLGVIYFDIHADLNTPASIRGGALDWMGVAHLLGEEHPTRELTQFGPRAPLLDDNQILLFSHGSRQSTAWELETISRRGLTTIGVDEVAANPPRPRTSPSPDPPKPSPHAPSPRPHFKACF